MEFIKDGNTFFNPTNMTNISLASNILGLILAGRNIGQANANHRFWYISGVIALGVAGFMIYKGSQPASKGA